MPDIGTGITAGTSLLGLDEGKKQADRAGALEAEMIAIERDRDEFNRAQIEEMNQFAREDRADIISRRNRDRALFDPLQEGIVSRAMEGPDYDGAMARSDADVAQAYGIARGTERRRQQSYGVNPASGRAAAMERRMGNDEALARVQGRSVARNQEDDRDWARKLAAFGTGNMMNATPTTSLAQLGVSGTSGALNTAAQNAGANASGAFQLFGKTAADAADMFNRGTGGVKMPSSRIDYDMYGEDAVN